MIREESPTDVVQRQLDAYNARDLERFMACFAPDARCFDLGRPEPTLDGREAIRARYEALFAASPQLHSRVVHRTAFGRAVIDHELIAGRHGSPDVFEIVAIYEVEDGLIRRFHAIRAE
jgi:uncharacterized protein (TIGR02246 family)